MLPEYYRVSPYIIQCTTHVLNLKKLLYLYTSTTSGTCLVMIHDVNLMTVCFNPFIYKACSLFLCHCIDHALITVQLGP